MDTLTHALLGALVVRAASPTEENTDGISIKRRTLIGGIAAAFPDIDFIGYWVSPLAYFADWHRGPTHSLLLAPLWALLMGLLLAWLSRHSTRWSAYFSLCLLALLSHIAADLITAWGTQILWPVSDIRPAFGITFIIDPWFSIILIIALFASMRFQTRTGARTGLATLSAYLLFQVILQFQARSLGEGYVNAMNLQQTRVQAFAQPLSPFNWLIIVSEGQRYHRASVNLAPWSRQSDNQTIKNASETSGLGQLQVAYQPSQTLDWQVLHVFGDVEQQSLANEVWQQEPLQQFRRFAKYPLLYRIDDGMNEDSTCVWFTDLRFVLPGMTPPFRFGLCNKGNTDDWQLFRLDRSN